MAGTPLPASTSSVTSATLEQILFPSKPPAATDLRTVVLPPVLRPHAKTGVLDITEFFGETTGGIRTYLLEKAKYVEAS
nr:hypothetical protein [Gemmatimonadaceae bacterium]